MACLPQPTRILHAHVFSTCGLPTRVFQSVRGLRPCTHDFCVLHTCLLSTWVCTRKGNRGLRRGVHYWRDVLGGHWGTDILWLEKRPLPTAVGNPLTFSLCKLWLALPRCLVWAMSTDNLNWTIRLAMLGQTFRSAPLILLFCAIARAQVSHPLRRRSLVHVDRSRQVGSAVGFAQCNLRENVLLLGAARGFVHVHRAVLPTRQLDNGFRCYLLRGLQN